jgi:hypothetical protein
MSDGAADRARIDIMRRVNWGKLFKPIRIAPSSFDFCHANGIGLQRINVQRYDATGGGLRCLHASVQLPYLAVISYLILAKVSSFDIVEMVC